MKTIKMTIELLSDTLSGSGEGFGAIIDTDVQYDEFGIPYISSKRIKGLLKNSLSDIFDMPAINEPRKEEILNKLFGEKGSVLPSSLEMSDFFIVDYENAKVWFGYLRESYPDIFSSEKILSSFTNIRRQTRVENGVAADHSLRTFRVVNKKTRFEADITLDDEFEEYFALACANLRRIGGKRNRGLGKVTCKLEGDIITDAIANLKKSLEVK
jgi:CRISPR-associated protein Csx10